MRTVPMILHQESAFFVLVPAFNAHWSQVNLLLYVRYEVAIKRPLGAEYVEYDPCAAGNPAMGAVARVGQNPQLQPKVRVKTLTKCTHEFAKQSAPTMFYILVTM